MLVRIAQLGLLAEGLLVRGEPLLVIELGRAEVVAAIDDEILALAQVHQRFSEVSEIESRPLVVVAQDRLGQIQLELDQELDSRWSSDTP